MMASAGTAMTHLETSMRRTKALPEYSNVRFVDAVALNAYLQQRELHVLDSSGPSSGSFSGASVLYHSWKPGFLEVSEAAAKALSELRLRAPDTALSPEAAALRATLDDLGWNDDGDVDLGMLVERTKHEFVALQNPVELERFLERVKALRPRVVVEIGTAAGGMLYCLAQLAHPEASIVSIDFPDGPYGGGQLDIETQVYRSFGGPQQQMAFIRDRSFHVSSMRDLSAILGDRPIDLLFIDGDHSYGAVLSDFEMYGRMVGKGGLTAFHDIILEPDGWGRGADAGVAWRAIRDRYRSEEIFDPNGITTPPSQRPETYDEMSRIAWGIGLVHH
jgi:predicted O-methyltransferase YrrM